MHYTQVTRAQIISKSTQSCIVPMACMLMCMYFKFQARPMLEFQVERDEEGEKWLTCVLFPQQGPQNPFDGMHRSVFMCVFVYVCVYTCK